MKNLKEHINQNKMWKRRGSTSVQIPDEYEEPTTSNSNRELSVVAHAHFLSLEDQLSDYVQQNKEIALKCHKLKEKVQYLEDEIECERIKNSKIAEEMTFYMQKNQNLELRCRVLENNLNQESNKNRMLIKEKQSLMMEVQSMQQSHQKAHMVAHAMTTEQIDMLEDQLRQMKLRKSELETLLGPPSSQTYKSSIENNLTSEVTSEEDSSNVNNDCVRTNEMAPRRVTNSSNAGNYFEENIYWEDDDYYMETNELDHRPQRAARRNSRCG